MRALYKKELRGLLPLLIVIGLVFGSDFFYRILDERIDEISWVGQSGQLSPGTGKDELAPLFLIFALIAAYSLFPREHDEKTIEFLYALPLQRRYIFFAKVFAAWTVLMFGIILEMLAGAVFQMLNPQSFSGEQWRWGLALQITLLDAFFCAVILTHGLLISFLRRLGLLVYLVAALAVALIKKHYPSKAFLDPNELLALDYQGTTLVIPWFPLLFHGLAGLVAAGLAYALWMGAAEKGTRIYARIQSRLPGRMALGCMSVLIFGSIFGLMMMAVDPEDLEPEQVRYQQFLPARAQSTWYNFTYPSNLGARARQLIREADRVYQEVADFMGDASGFRIDADLTDEGSGHLGIAQGGVIRVALESLAEEEALYTLYHETVHAFQSQLAGRRANEHAGNLRFFVEGSAEYVARGLYPDPDARKAHHRLAVAAYERHDIRFEELVDDDEFKAHFDSSLVYVLGETWASAMAVACGPDIVGRFFRALDRPEAPEGLAGIALWQDTLSAVDCGLEPVLAQWNLRMTELVRSEQDFLDGLPRLGGGVIEEDAEAFVFRLQPDRPVAEPAETYYLRVRRDPSVPDDQIYAFTSEMAEDGSGASFRVPRAWFAGETFECQFGQSIEGSLWAFFEEWQLVSP